LHGITRATGLTNQKNTRDQLSTSSVIADERIGCGAPVSSGRLSLRPKIKTKRPPVQAITACSNQNDAGLIRS